ncbi:hypothetical protein [Mesorhizobium sp. CA14]|uniref:hypothetical protein n=1 Tax=Mesorhizobium sp. CA14 TaxID=2876642 RepID=UPI001CCA7D41|nr:hypothetical protein [Mesorhizobium sp. CA14]
MSPIETLPLYFGSAAATANAAAEAAIALPSAKLNVRRRLSFFMLFHPLLICRSCWPAVANPGFC